jgi:transcriptional regulator with XRE-family HTH domain
MKIERNISATLKREMVRRKLSLVEFSQALQIPRTTLVGYLNGSSHPRADSLEYLAIKLGISLAELVSGAEYPHNEGHPCLEPILMELPGLPPMFSRSPKMPSIFYRAHFEYPIRYITQPEHRLRLYTSIPPISIFFTNLQNHFPVLLPMASWQKSIVSTAGLLLH